MDIVVFVPLPCKGDANVYCIKKGLKITGFKSCSENTMTTNNNNFTDPCA